MRICDRRIEERGFNDARALFLMPINLPNLSSTQAARLVACGKISTKQRDISSWLEQHRSMICRYSVGGASFFARLITGGFTGHFHLECASVDSFSQQRPKPNTKRKDFDQATERMIGQQLALRLRCYFLCDIEGLAPKGIIRTLSTETIAAGVTMKLTSGVLSLSGSPVDKVEWTLIGEGQIRVGLDTVLSRTITPDYLIGLQNWSRSLFDVIILNKEDKPNA